MGWGCRCVVRRCPLRPNIAEGFRRRGKADKARFLNMAEGSVEECRYFLILTKDLGYGDTQALSAALDEISNLLGAYSAAILDCYCCLLAAISQMEIKAK